MPAEVRASEWATWVVVLVVVVLILAAGLLYVAE
jgi:Sec-independent protein translocase protein TatA